MVSWFWKMLTFDRLFYDKVSVTFMVSNYVVAQSAGAVEYTDCTSAEG